jgi:hypothetical protein
MKLYGLVRWQAVDGVIEYMHEHTKLVHNFKTIF